MSSVTLVQATPAQSDGSDAAQNGGAATGSANCYAVAAPAPLPAGISRRSTPVVRNWCYTRIQTVTFAFTWIINNFVFCEEKTGESLDSDTFSVSDPPNESKLCLRAYPRGVNPENKDFFSVYLVLISSSMANLQVKCKFSVLNAKGEAIHCTGDDNTYTLIRGKTMGYPKLFERELLLKTNRHLHDLIISCEGTVAVNKENISGPCGERQLDQSVFTLSDDFGALLENSKLSDVTLSVGKKDFFVHKVILAARSPVFAAMFDHQLEESKQNRVIIEDVEYSVLKEMLVYMYTGRSPKIEKMADGLLAVADKYDMSELKAMCEDVLGSVLTADSAAFLLVFADMHNAKQLKSTVIHFINTHAKDVMQTTAWKNMISQHTHLLAEVYEALAVK